MVAGRLRVPVLEPVVAGRIRISGLEPVTVHDTFEEARSYNRSAGGLRIPGFEPVGRAPHPGHTFPGGPMYTVSVQAHYDAAHFLRNYKGKCERLHGHRYVVEAALQAEELNEAGIAYDFVDLKRELRDLAEALDHRNLNDLPAFQERETSAENQARWFFEELRERLPEALADGLLYTRVWETPTQWAQYGPAPVTPPAHRSPTMG